MASSPRTRLVNPWLGTYFGIFTSLIVALVLVLLIFEQLGTSARNLSYLMLAGPLALVAAIGLASWTEEGSEYFASGRRVPVFFLGSGLAVSASGATLLVCGTGAFFINGFDAWSLAVGAVAGLVFMAVLIAPYFRKFGTYTLPSFLGRRFDSRLLAIVAAAVFVMPTMLILIAELKIGLFVLGWLTGLSSRVIAGVLVVSIVATLALGGMRSLSWSNTGQAILALLAILVPAIMVAVVLTNLPLPQLSYGPVLRAIGRTEAAQAIPVPILSPLSFGLAGNGLESLGRRFASPFGSLGYGSYMLVMLTMIAGIAAAPWLLPRTTTTTGVYEARKSLGWAVVLLAIAMVTISAIAVFMRDLVMDQLAGQNRAEHPQWFAALVKAGLADLDSRQTRPPLSAFSFHRDSALFMLPIAYGYPLVILHLMLIGAAAAALAAAGNASVALAHIVAEDVVGGLASTPVADRLRINVARVSLLLITIAGVVIASTVAADPLRLFLWAMAIAASTAFPAAVMAIWWKRANALAIAASLVAGFVTSVGLLFAFEAALFGVPSVFAGVFGMPAAFAAAAIVTWITPAPQRHVLETASDLRTPGGETMFDRELRLQRLKQRQGK